MKIGTSVRDGRGVHSPIMLGGYKAPRAPAQDDQLVLEPGE